MDKTLHDGKTFNPLALMDLGESGSSAVLLPSVMLEMLPSLRLFKLIKREDKIPGQQRETQQNSAVPNRSTMGV